MKKHIYYFIIILIPVIGLGIYGYRVKPTVSTDELPENRLQVIDEKNEINIWPRIETLTEQLSYEGLCVIDMIPVSLEQDAYNRYFAIFQVLGIDEKEKIDVYDYYMVLQEARDEELYIRPKGVKIVKCEGNQMKSNVIISTMKIIHNWGRPDEINHKDIKKSSFYSEF